MFQQKLRSHNAEDRKQENDDRQLEDQSDTQDQRGGQAPVLIDADHRLKLMAECHEELERRREGHLVSEEAARHEEAAGQHHKRQDVLFFVAVEAGRDEQPNLPQDKRRGEEDARDDGKLDVEIKRVRGIRINELVGQMEFAQRLDQRARQEGVNIVSEVEANPGPDQKRDDRPQKPLAEFLEMLEERHLSAA